MIGILIGMICQPFPEDWNFDWDDMTFPLPEYGNFDWENMMIFNDDTSLLLLKDDDDVMTFSVSDNETFYHLSIVSMDDISFSLFDNPI